MEMGGEMLKILQSGPPSFGAKEYTFLMRNLDRHLLLTVS